MTNDPLHDDPANWVWGFIYFCKDDPRVVVPKRLRYFGWTLNFARPMALPALLLAIGAILLILQVVGHLAHALAAIILSKLVIAAVLIWVCVRLASPPAGR